MTPPPRSATGLLGRSSSSSGSTSSMHACRLLGPMRSQRWRDSAGMPDVHHRGRSTGLWRFWGWLLLIVVLFTFQGVRFAERLVTWEDESGYLQLGYFAVSGRISLFQDEIPGTRMPLPYYVLGATQLLWGRSLMAARLSSLALGLAALILVAAIARRIGGDAAGLLAASFFATQGVLVGYFSTATYYSLSALILLAGLALLICSQAQATSIIAMAVLSLLILTRTNLWAIPPAVLAFAVVRAQTWVHRLQLVTAASAVPVAFFLWDVRHLKIFAYVPLLGRLVEPLGYRSTLPLTAFRPFQLGDWPIALLRLVRMYEFWALAVATAAAFLVARALQQKGAGELFRNRALVLLIVFLGYVALSQCVVFLDRLKQYPAYFPSWAPIVPIILGVVYSALLSLPDLGRWPRRLLVAVLAVALTAPIVIVRHPLLPSGPEIHPVASRQLDAAVAHFRRIIPATAKVFLLGNPLPLYLAGRDPYLQQIYSTETLAAVENRNLIPTHGLWGIAEIEAWLSADAGYAVVQPAVLAHYRATRRLQIERIEALLAQRFVRIDQVDEYPWFTFDVYERRKSPIDPHERVSRETRGGRPDYHRSATGSAPIVPLAAILSGSPHRRASYQLSRPTL
jgi:hypothetical protein